MAWILGRNIGSQQAGFLEGAADNRDIHDYGWPKL
jgi:hypothetical protein